MIVSDSPSSDRTSPNQQGDDLLDRLLNQCSRLYTLPAVAMELLQLTSDARIGVAELKACIERDPALTAKILRVVNSSLYGLSAEVGNLGQAVALLGMKPLKLLVLGFSLPDELFTEVAGEQLERYWSTALVRAVAAKAIAETFYQRDGDDAFIAGLIDDLGMLVMLGQLGEPYARFLQVAWDEEGDVRHLERQSLDFDHSQLTAALLTQWNMPRALVSAVTAAADPERLRKRSAGETLARILYLANLTAGLVGRHRLNVLPELLESGTEFCGLDKPALTSLVEQLEPKVADLAEAMEVRLPQGRRYLEILADAQARLAELGEEVAAPLARLDHAEQLLNQLSHQWSETKSDSSAGSTSAATNATRKGSEDAPPSGGSLPRREALAVLQRVVADCRACRDELAVVLLGAGNVSSAAARDVSLPSLLTRAVKLLRQACREAGIASEGPWRLSECRSVIVLPRCTRKEAIDLVRGVQSILGASRSGTMSGEAPWISAGVAAVDTPPRNFEWARLLDAAERCLFAAESSGGQIKSIELY